MTLKCFKYHLKFKCRWCKSLSYKNKLTLIHILQDTSVALDALSRYASKIKNKNTNLDVEIKAGADTYNVLILSEDKLKNKDVLLHGVPTKIDIKINGTGCLLTQALYGFNLKHMTYSEAFKLGVDVNPVSTIDKCSIAIISPCISYTGTDLHSNMAVLEVTMPSGYEADTESLYKIVDEPNTSMIN